MDASQLLETIGEAVMLNGDNAAIRIVATYEPIAGKGAKIFPIDADYAGNNRKRIVERWVAEVLNAQ